MPNWFSNLFSRLDKPKTGGTVMSEKKYVVAIDQGTTSSRAIVFDLEGTPKNSHQMEHGEQ